MSRIRDGARTRPLDTEWPNSTQCWTHGPEVIPDWGHLINLYYLPLVWPGNFQSYLKYLDLNAYFLSFAKRRVHNFRFATYYQCLTQLDSWVSGQNPFLSTNSVPKQITPPFHAVGSHIAIDYNKAGLQLLVSTVMEHTYENVTVDQSEDRALYMEVQDSGLKSFNQWILHSNYKLSQFWNSLFKLSFRDSNLK